MVNSTAKPAPSWIVPNKPAAEFYTRERCYITEMLNTDASPQMSIALARVEPEVTTQLHALKGVAEVYILKSGTGLVEVDGVQREVETGDQVIIAAGLSQRISNTGATDLEFYCICTPRFTPDCYLGMEPDATPTAKN